MNGKLILNTLSDQLEENMKVNELKFQLLDFKYIYRQDGKSHIILIKDINELHLSKHHDENLQLKCEQKDGTQLDITIELNNSFTKSNKEIQYLLLTVEHTKEPIGSWWYEPNYQWDYVTITV